MIRCQPRCSGELLIAFFIVEVLYYVGKGGLGPDPDEVIEAAWLLDTALNLASPGCIPPYKAVRARQWPISVCPIIQFFKQRSCCDMSWAGRFQQICIT